MNFPRSLSFVLVFFIFLFSTRGFASPKKWSGSGELSFVSSRGNANSWTFGGKLQTRWSGKVLGLDMEIGALKTRSRGRTEAEDYEVSQKGTWKVGPKAYVYERIGWDQSRLAGIQSRIDLNVGGGLRWVRPSAFKLSVEAGGGFLVEERTASGILRFPAGRLALDFVWDLGSTAKLAQSVEYTTDLKKLGDYRAQTETSLVSAISKRFSVKLAFQWRRNSPPPAGFLKDDFRTMSALIINY